MNRSEHKWQTFNRDMTFVERLIHHYSYFNFKSDFTILFSIKGLKIKFRPLSYDPIPIYAIFGKRIYGVPSSECTIVDIGAHIGAFSLYCCLHNVLQVFAYEPEYSNFSLLYENVAMNHISEKIRVFNSAVWAHDDNKLLFTSKGTAGHSFYRGMDQNGGSQLVTCKGINSVLDPLEYPVLIKLDAESSEFEILTHMNRKNADKVKRMELEYHMGSRGAELRFPILLEWLRSRKFEISLHGTTLLSAAKGRVSKIPLRNQKAK